MTTIVYCIATWMWDGWQDCIKSWRSNASRRYPEFIVYNKSIMDAYQECWLGAQDYQYTDPILMFAHDDLKIYEKGWDLRVLKEFDDPTVGLVGFAGAMGHGKPQLYNEPFRISNLVRMDFLSNLRNAEDHGYRFAGETTVAVLDGLALFIRRTVLDKWGGWPVNTPLGYWMYAEALCCETRRQGYKIRLVGVDCEHLGGKTASMVQVKDDYEKAHIYFAEHNRDVMPYYVEEQ